MTYGSKNRAPTRRALAQRSGSSRKGTALTPKKPSPRRGPSPGKTARAPRFR